MRDVQARLREFASARNWEKFHTPKNLAMAVAGEAGELVAEFQWLTEDESWRGTDPSSDLHQRVVAELADVAIYAALLADVMGVDLQAAMLEKIEVNEHRFPPSTPSGHGS